MLFCSVDADIIRHLEDHRTDASWLDIGFSYDFG